MILARRDVLALDVGTGPERETAHTALLPLTATEVSFSAFAETVKPSAETAASEERAPTRRQATRAANRTRQAPSLPPITLTDDAGALTLAAPLDHNSR